MQGPFSEWGRPLLFLRPFSGNRVPDHLGEFNAATSRELELTFGIKGIEVRHLVNQLRRDGVPIASSGNGYFYAATEQEVRATIAHLTRRISGIAAAIRGLNRSLERFDTEQTCLPLDGGDSP